MRLLPRNVASKYRKVTTCHPREWTPRLPSRGGWKLPPNYRAIDIRYLSGLPRNTSLSSARQKDYNSKRLRFSFGSLACWAMKKLQISGGITNSAYSNEIRDYWGYKNAISWYIARLEDEFTSQRQQQDWASKRQRNTRALARTCVLFELQEREFAPGEGKFNDRSDRALDSFFLPPPTKELTKKALEKALSFQR